MHSIALHGYAGYLIGRQDIHHWGRMQCPCVQRLPDDATCALQPWRVWHAAAAVDAEESHALLHLLSCPLLPVQA